ncbi:MAG: hypothetical protein WBO18_15160 [Gammaproteobacteria bacterium]
MSLYSYDKLIEETRKLAAEFRRSTGTMLPVSGEIARHDVSRHLDLELNKDQAAGFDAIGRNARQGLRVQIQSRVVGDHVKPGHRLGQLNPDGHWDLVILSLMNEEFEPMEMYEATREEIIEAIQEINSNRKKRGAISVAKFRIIGKLVWTRETGVEH